MTHVKKYIIEFALLYLYNILYTLNCYMNKTYQNFFDFLLAVPDLFISSDGLYYLDCRALENFCKACCVLTAH